MRSTNPVTGAIGGKEQLVRSADNSKSRMNLEIIIPPTGICLKDTRFEVRIPVTILLFLVVFNPIHLTQRQACGEHRQYWQAQRWRSACRYVVLQAEGRDFKVDFIRVSYDIERTARAIEASDMPNEYAGMLRTGMG